MIFSHVVRVTSESASLLSETRTGSPCGCVTNQSRKSQIALLTCSHTTYISSLSPYCVIYLPTYLSYDTQAKQIRNNSLLNVPNNSRGSYEGVIQTYNFFCRRSSLFFTVVGISDEDDEIDDDRRSLSASWLFQSESS